MRKRRIHRRKTKTQKRIIIGLFITLLCFSFEYAAFSTNVNLSAKGNIYKISDKCFDTSDNGDGLYQDIYENNGYIYKGLNPNNFIRFNNELWRIISINSNNNLKIIKYYPLNNSVLYDSVNARTDGYSIKGCNAWAKTDNYSTQAKTGTVAENSELNNYLNNTYYTTINDNNKTLITNGVFHYGAIIGDEETNEIIKKEKLYQIISKVGIISDSDGLKAYSIDNCNYQSVKENMRENCKLSNYLIPKQNFMYTSTAFDYSNFDIYSF